VGVVFTPSFVPGFSATIDYTDIKITNLVQSYGSNTIQANCLASADPNSSWCKKIHRTVLGDIWTSYQGYIVDPLLNEGGLENKGIDLGMAYRLDLGSLGKFRSRLDAGYLLKLLYSPGSGKSYECAGQFGPTCSANTPPAPKYRHRLALDWDTPLTGFSTGLTWRYYGSVQNSLLNPGSPDYKGAAYGIPPDAQLPKISFLDMRVSYNINKVTVRVGANNILDKDPPTIDTLNDTGNSIYGESNTFPSMYDTLGRYIYANVTIDF
jgi:outer membrane receptor protein involved in Fe transport